MSDQTGTTNQGTTNQQQADDVPSIFKPLALQRQSNQAATVGLVLAVLLWPAGLVVSIVALRRASQRGGAGLYKGIFGVFTSFLFAVITLALLLTGPAKITDPGCGPAEASFSGLGTTILADQTQLNNDLGKPAEQQDLTKFIALLQPVQNGLEADIAMSDHPTVGNELSIAYSDVGALITQLQQLQNSGGDNGDVLQLTRYSDNLVADISGVDQVCKGNPAPAATQ